MTAERADGRGGLAASALLTMVKIYRACLSPILGGQCRFIPTCSNSFAEAVAEHGALRGGIMGAWRVLRCNPLCTGGYDPVPHRPRGRTGD